MSIPLIKDLREIIFEYVISYSDLDRETFDMLTLNHKKLLIEDAKINFKGAQLNTFEEFKSAIHIANERKNSKGECYRCDAAFISSVSDGGDYVSCCFCGENMEDSHEINQTDINYWEVERKEYIKQRWFYCNNCENIFKWGCLHHYGGCSSFVYFGKIVVSYILDGKVYQGSPKFSTFEQFESNWRKYNFELLCMCNQTISGKNGYTWCKNKPCDC